jgi:hypothetical protein
MNTDMGSSQVIEFIHYYRKYNEVLDRDTGHIVNEYHGPILGVFAVQVDRENNQYRVGWSLANKNDGFDRERGQEVAIGRLTAYDWIPLSDIGATEFTRNSTSGGSDRRDLAYMEVDDSGIKPVYRKRDEFRRSIPDSMIQFYKNIIVPRISRIANPKKKEMTYIDKISESFMSRS